MSTQSRLIITKCILALIFCCLGCGSKAEFNEESLASKDLQKKEMALKDLKKIRNYMTKQIPKVTNASDFEKSRLLRGWLRAHFFTGNNYTPIDWTSRYDALIKTTTNPKYEIQCGDMTRVYRWVLAAFSIPSRKVGLYNTLDLRSLNNLSHSTIEIFVDGHWIASDVAYNLQWQDDKENYLSYQQARDLYLADPLKLHYVHNNGGLPSNSDWMQPGADHTSFFNHVVTYPGPDDEFLINFSRGWNGQYIRPDGNKAQLKPLPGIFWFNNIFELYAQNDGASFNFDSDDFQQVAGRSQIQLFY
jgi:hypothetical protein